MNVAVWQAQGNPSRAWRAVRVVGIALIGGLNAWLLMTTVSGLFSDAGARDWGWLIEAGQRFQAGQNPYADLAFRWSPLTAYFAVPLSVVPVIVWRLAHFAALALLPRKVALLVALSYPFWWDVELGNVNAFALGFAFLALRGKPWPFVILALLVPRPLYLPVLAWLLWRNPGWRVPFAILAGVSLLGAFLTGWGDEWIAGLTRTAGDLTNEWNWGPSRLVGVAWLPIGAALAAWLMWKGRLGLASLAASPYVLPYYLLMGFLELRDLDRGDPGPDRRSLAVPLDLHRPAAAHLAPELVGGRRAWGDEGDAEGPER